MTSNVPASGNREYVCACCGQAFTPLGRRGPPARYCRPAHRQRALGERRLDADRAELVALRGLVAGLTGLTPARGTPGSRISTRVGAGQWLLVLTGPDGSSELLGRYTSVAVAELALRRRRQAYRRVCGARVADRLDWRVTPAEPG